MKRKTIILLLGLSLVLTIGLVRFYFFLENMIYQEINSTFPGDCGHFVVWMSSMFNYKESDLLKITYQISPLVVITGPITIKKNLEKLGIKSKFYNSFSIEEIKQKLDRGKNVIVVINTGSKFMGATHYLFLTDYDEKGFYFFDAFYALRRYYETDKFEPYFLTFEDFEDRRRNVLSNSQIVGWLENIIGFKNFALVIGEQGKDNLSFFVKFVLSCEYILERMIEFVGRTVVYISPKI